MKFESTQVLGSRVQSALERCWEEACVLLKIGFLFASWFSEDLKNDYIIHIIGIYIPSSLIKDYPRLLMKSWKHHKAIILKAALNGLDLVKSELAN